MGPPLIMSSLLADLGLVVNILGGWVVPLGGVAHGYLGTMAGSALLKDMGASLTAKNKSVVTTISSPEMTKVKDLLPVEHCWASVMHWIPRETVVNWCLAVS